MEPTAKTLLEALPPYQDKWVMVHPNQAVDDIIRNVLDKHKDFSAYYDKIALYFDSNDVDEICDKLYKFCKRYLRYREECEDWQRTALPTGFLPRASCDCKGYASFCGGILDAINRLKGKKIDWNYVFASYDLLDKTPHHVFIECEDDGEPIWIDPTPEAEQMTPVWIMKKKVEGMPLYSNIAGTHTHQRKSIGGLYLDPFTDAGQALNYYYNN